jgi:hypothetical protein
MPLKRISEQRSLTIEGYYSEIANETNPASIPERGKAMLTLIELLNTEFPNNIIWALTSVDRLVLLNNDKSSSQWFVRIACLGFTEFYIEYKMPSEKSPWSDAWISGLANSPESAKEYVMIAMKESHGWTNIFK